MRNVGLSGRAKNQGSVGSFFLNRFNRKAGPPDRPVGVAQVTSVLVLLPEKQKEVLLRQFSNDTQEELRLSLERGPEPATPRYIAALAGTKFTRELQRSETELLAKLIARIELDPESVANDLRERLESATRITIGQALEAIRVSGLGAPEAAIMLSVLPPELSLAVFDQFEVPMSEAVSMHQEKLATPDEALTHRTLCHFLELSAKTYTLEHVTDVLVQLARAGPRKLADEIESFYRKEQRSWRGFRK